MPIAPSHETPPIPAANIVAPPEALADRFRARLLEMNARPWPWLTLLLVLLAMQVGPWWYPTPDARSYLSMARSFAAGERMTNLGREQLYYSPGYSLLISPTFVFGDRPFLAISLLQLGMATLAMFGVYRWARRLTHEGALFITALAFVNVLVWIHYRRSLSEIPFLCAAIWTAIAIEWTLDATAWRSAILRALPAATLLMATCLLRQAGISLAAGLGVALVCEVVSRRIHLGRAILLLSLISLPALLAIFVVMRNDVLASAGEETYLDGFVAADRSLAAQVVECARMRISDIGRVLVPGMFKSYSRAGSWLNANVPIYLIVTSIVAIGWWRLVRARRDIVALAFPFYLALYMTWPFETGGRFLVPLAPLLAVCLWFAIEPYVRHRLNVLAGLVVLHLAVALGYWAAIDLPRAIDYFQRWESIDALAGAVDTHHASVAAVNLPIETRLMLELALDRSVVEGKDFAALEVTPEWVIEPTGGAPRQGFFIYRGTDELQLLTRTCAAHNVGSTAVKASRGATTPRR